MTDLRSTLERYVNMRQGLGYKFSARRKDLPTSSPSWSSAKL